MKKKLLFIFLAILLTGSAAAWAQSEKVLIYKGFAYSYYEKHKNYYYTYTWGYDTADSPNVPVGKARFAVFSAKNGQGWIVFDGMLQEEWRVIRKGPGFQYPVKETNPYPYCELCDKYYPCLGKVGNWYKVRSSDGGIGYVYRREGCYWTGDGPIGKNRKPIL